MRVFVEVEGEREVMIGQFQVCERVKVWGRAEVMVRGKIVFRL